MKLIGKSALITGSSSGIGRGVAVAFAHEGAQVAINYPTPGEAGAAQSVCAEIESGGGKAIAIQADVADEDAVAQMVETTRDAFGQIDILVNNAGIAHTAAIEDTDVAIWDRVLAVHLRSTFLATRLVLPGMYAQGFGRIINTASQLAYKGAPGLSAYTAAKGAIISLTRSVALEIGARNVTINCVAPGATKTPILDDVSEDLMEQVRQAIPIGRLAEVEDIVPTYVLLASEDGRHYQGQCLSPNGGDVFL